jgi:hypothetical protein
MIGAHLEREDHEARSGCPLGRRPKKLEGDPSMRSVISICLAVLLVAGCSSGGGGPAAPSLSGTSIEFTPANGPAQDAVVLSLRGSTDESVTFDLLTRQVSTPVTAAAFELQFDPAHLSLETFSVGGLLSGVTVARVAPVAGQGGRLVGVFAQRDFARGGTGTGVIGTIMMKLQPGSYSTALELTPSSTLIGEGGNLIQGEAFLGGTLTVQR